ncbi:MAG: type II toxin-antitoxin system VapB family antitoxin [Stagnimonas sp.]|nr:type II toxin-antitoxin system VapB family antitoxin [Stagnimonas sp.]
MNSATAKIFETGRSQAVRLPKAYRFDCDEVLVERDGNRLILTPKPRRISEFFDSPHFKPLSSDFPARIADAHAEPVEPL